MTDHGKRARVGDVFVLSVEDGKYLFGRVAKKGVLYRPALLLYIYAVEATKPSPVPESLARDSLLVPPILTNQIGFTEGFFQILSSGPIQPEDIFEKHCFVNPFGAYLDEAGQRVDAPFEPLARTALAGYGAVGIRVVKALGIWNDDALAPDQGNALTTDVQAPSGSSMNDGNPLEREVSEFLNHLEGAERAHAEVTDTSVREALAEVLSWHFVWGKRVDVWPTDYALFGPAGNRRVAEAVRAFLEAAIPRAEELGVPVGPARLEILQDVSIETEQGECYDLFLGHLDEPLDPRPPGQSRYREPVGPEDDPADEQ